MPHERASGSWARSRRVPAQAPARAWLRPWASALASALLICGCAEGSSIWSNEAEEAQGDELGTRLWYRVRVQTGYAGRPVSFDQFVFCGLRTVPGGSFGATPPITSRYMHPMSVGREMPDGSFVALRLPDLCLTNRAYAGKAPGPSTRLPAWRNRGPFTALPLLVWSDRRFEADRTELYLATEAYASSSAKLTKPVVEITFLPTGFRPADAEAIEAMANALEDNASTLGRPEPADRKSGLLFGEALLPVSDLTGPAVSGQGAAESSGGGAADVTVYDGPKVFGGPSTPGEERAAELVSPVEALNCVRDLQAGRPVDSDVPNDMLLHDEAPVAIARATAHYERQAAQCRGVRAGVIPIVLENGRLVADRRRAGIIVLNSSARTIRSFSFEGRPFFRSAWLRDRLRPQVYANYSFMHPVIDPRGGE